MRITVAEKRRFDIGQTIGSLVSSVFVLLNWLLVCVLCLGRLVAFRYREVPLDRISATAFAAQLNSLFLVQSGTDGTVPLQLVEVRPLGLTNPGTALSEDA
jgi:hypothetical protein